MELCNLKKEFLKVFGGNDENIRFFTAPGRVNLIGEHIDYNGGHVFPAALTVGTTIVLRKRNDGILRMKATDLDGIVEADVSTPGKYKDIFWGNYQVGVALELIKKGYDIVGCDMLYEDTVPHGGGLSSSAAVEVATALALATLSNEKNGITAPVDMTQMALISQAAEHNFCGVNCGIMDQFASAMGKENHAINLDCSTLDYELVPFELNKMKLVLTNTNIKHSLGSSKYNERRSECDEGLKELKRVLPDIKLLADVSVADFEKHKDVIKNETVKKRVKHVVYECERVSKSIEALKKGDIETFGKLMNLSHDSLRDDYEVTCPELDFLVEKARELKGVIGTRMTGAGFGGCTVSVVKEENVEEFVEISGVLYKERFGIDASFYITEIGNGGRELKF